MMSPELCPELVIKQYA